MAKAGANYFYGFLITFICIMGFVLSCGVGPRRARRRRMLMELAWDQANTIQPPKPKLWEPPLVNGGSEWTWDSIVVRYRCFPCSLALIAHSH